MDFDRRQMVAIPMGAFVRGLPIQVDSYIALNDEKFVLVFKAGTPIDVTRLAEYRDRNLRTLHVRKEDARLFFSSQMTLANKALASPSMPTEQRLHFLNMAHQILMSKLESVGFSSESYEAARSIARSVISIVSMEPKLLQLLATFERASSGHLNHSMAVGAVSAMIGKGLGWTRGETLEKLIVGGIFHDIGLLAISPRLLELPIATMTSEELCEYGRHVDEGVRILASVPNVHSDVIAIVREHHENAVGKGYPQRLRDVKMNPLAKVVALADALCELTLPSPSHPKPMTYEEALLQIEYVMEQPFNKDAFKRLKALILEAKSVPIRVA